VNDLKDSLSSGEREAIALAMELDDLLVVDEKKARKICEEKGIKKTGVYGLIRRAHENCTISRRELEEKAQKLKADLFYQPWLIDYILTARKSEEELSDSVP
jgi:predicted nucleic acid-binding protein